MIEKYFVEYCAPTLASIKTANLFNIKSELNEEFYRFVNDEGNFFEERGIKTFVLREDRKTLIYVCRVKKLTYDLFNEDTKAYLESIGYKYETMEEAINCLRDRINETKEFPHEIGLFLGYPLEDVIGFIKNKGQNYKVCGHWKVYNEEKNSVKMFEMFNKCKDVYLRRWGQGSNLYKLTVAA